MNEIPNKGTAVIILLEEGKEPTITPVCETEEQEPRLVPLMERAQRMREVA